jgi:hypothetical protein
LSNAFKATVCLAALLCAFPATAMANPVNPSIDQTSGLDSSGPLVKHDADGDKASAAAASQNTLEKRKSGMEPCPAPVPVSQKILPYSQVALDAVGTQAGTGHTICCPAFSCAYGDAVMDGTVHDHSYYGCGSCVWTDWGGGGSSFRCVGTDEQLLREAYDQISAGKPTVIHVSASSGEHWICLIGYIDAVDPDALTLDNFIALDPWDGSQLVAGSRFSPYGDGCEHISSRV